MIHLHVSTCLYIQYLKLFWPSLLAPPCLSSCPPDCSSPQPSRSELDETLKRLQQHKGVTGVIVVNGEEGGRGGRTRVERDDKRRPKTYAVREQFSLFLVCWVETENFLFLLFESGFDDAMNMENDNINNSLECLEMS